MSENRVRWGPAARSRQHEQGPEMGHGLQVRAGECAAWIRGEDHLLLALRRAARGRVASLHAHEGRRQRQDGQPRLRRPAARRAPQRPSGARARALGEGKVLRRRADLQSAGRRHRHRRDRVRRRVERRRATSRRERPERRRQQRHRRQDQDGGAAQTARRAAHEHRGAEPRRGQARRERQDHHRRQVERAGMGRRREHRPFRRRGDR